MKSRILKAFLGISLLSFLSGCAMVGSALNPYEDNFKCSKKAPFGTCETTMEVYADLVAAPVGNAASTVAPGQGAGVPAGYEIVAAPDSLPTYSIGAGEGNAAKDKYLMVKKPAATAEVEPVTVVAENDGGDGVVYPSVTKAKPAKVEAPAPAPGYAVRPKPETAYREASLAKAAKLLKEPVTPVVIPPLVMRILILPRKGEDGELNMAQFSYVMVDKPRWAMGEYLSMIPEE
ncbi:TraV family lipoprotein [Geomonas subterranea]|uniref:TraV family lipoprotein n=1 Tax=Geomonas subterranea TaxID=2847989 RepID=UPI001CD4073F|nr:TraV family lipoprotein [Geomonas fuzhouensis]